MSATSAVDAVCVGVFDEAKWEFVVIKWDKFHLHHLH